MHHGQLRMAYRLANSHHRDKLLHVYGVGWHRWDGKRWASDDQGHAVRAVRQVLRRALEASLDLDTDAAKAIRRDVDRCSSAPGAAGVLALAATMAPFAATVRDLDADAYLLNCANGTLDLRTLQLRPHDPDDRITKITVAAYDETAHAAAWDKFLDRVLPDADVREFLQRLAGVALLGRVVEHVLGILTGPGANGKGVFTRSVEYAFGDYAATAEAELFMAREGAHPTGEMDLLGRRWVTVSETDQGRRLAEATMKRLTGGDTIKARKMRQDFVEFQPSHTAVLVTNHLPAVRGDDPAIWRRIRVVPFDVVIPEAERDKHLDERLQLQAEAVLAWAVAGYRDYANRGDLGEPRAVTAATSTYRLDSDPVARFIDEECITTPAGYAAMGELFARWQRWAPEDGAPEISQKAFGQALDRKGYASDKYKGTRIRRGLVLAESGGEGW
jgi:putative DNA primase/helicase